MTDQELERISALLDGELDRHEQDRTVSRLLAGDVRGLDRFGRYRLIGDVLRGESTVLADSVRARVSGALKEEPTALAPRTPAGRWTKPAAGIALTASVALAAVVLAPQFLQQPAALVPVQTVVTAPVPAASQPTRLVVANPGPPQLADRRDWPAAGQWETLDARLAERLNRLVIEHHEFGGRTGINGPVAHIGLVNYAGR